MPEDIKIKKCKNAIMAAAEILSQEACEGGTMVTLPVGDGLLIWVPEEAIKEIGYSPHSPATPEEIERGITKIIEATNASRKCSVGVGGSLYIVYIGEEIIVPEENNCILASELVEGLTFGFLERDFVYASLLDLIYKGKNYRDIEEEMKSNAKNWEEFNRFLRGYRD